MTDSIFLDPAGPITVRNPDGATRLYPPGIWQGEEWVPTSIGDLPPGAREPAADHWTPQLVSAYRYATEPVPPASEELWAALRIERDRRISEMDWVIARQQEQQGLGVPLALTPELFDAVFVYRQALRDLPENTVDPANPVWPENPLASA